jgi:hypothetical protein
VLLVGIPVEPEGHLRALDQNRPLDEVWLLHHQVDRLFLGLRQRPRFEHRAPRADEIEEAVGVDMLLEKRAIGRVLVDVPFFDVDLLLLQKTSGVSAGRSRGLEVEDRLGHIDIVRLGRGTITVWARC